VDFLSTLGWHEKKKEMILFYDCVYGCYGNAKRKSIEFLWISDRDTLACIENLAISMDF
jgi:hypothetical protein